LSGGPGMADASSGLLVHHQAKNLKSQLEIFKELTCDQAILDDPERAPEAIARVLSRCLHESRPVYIEVPRDKVFAPTRAVPDPLPAPPVNSEARESCASEVLRQVGSARSPVLLVGIEIRRFGLESAVADLATKLGMPVVT